MLLFIFTLLPSLKQSQSQLRYKNLGKFLFSHFFMKALKAFIKPFWGTTKKFENKYLHEIHFGKKARNTQNGKG